MVFAAQIPISHQYHGAVTVTPESLRGRIPELDGIRGLAILLVLVWHYLICEVGAPPPLFRFLNQTWSGVNLFFVLSGFLIGGILLDHREARNYYRVFYIRRACRILPIYIVWLLLFYILRGPVSRLPLGTASVWLLADPLPFWSYVTFTQNFLQGARGVWGPNWLAVTWSLAVEEQFYLLLPFIVRLTPPRRLPLVLAPFILLAPLFRFLFFDPKMAVDPSYVLLICKADALLLGVLCAWLARCERATERIRARAPLLRILLLSCVGFVCLDAYVPETATIRALNDSLLAIGYAALILLALYTPRSPMARIAGVRWLRALGLIAYGTYLIHQTVNGLIFGAIRKHWPYITEASDLFVIITALVITMVAATLSWRYFEKPIVNFGRRWRYADPAAVE